MKSIGLGLNDQAYSTYIDILGLNGGIQLISIFSDYAWYGYLLIPGWIIYKGAGIVWGWL